MLLRAMEEWKEGSTGCTNDNDQVSQNDVILSSNFAHGRSNDRSGYNIGNFKHTKIVNKIGYAMTIAIRDALIPPLPKSSSAS